MNMQAERRKCAYIERLHDIFYQGRQSVLKLKVRRTDLKMRKSEDMLP